MAAPRIIARDWTSAHAFARETLGFDRGTYVVVTGAVSLSGIRNVDVYLAPGWRCRPDRFSIQSALRWGRLNVINAERVSADPVEQEVLAEELGQPVDEDVLERAEHRDAVETFQDAYADSQLPPERQPTRRRRRCKECGVLVHPDEVDIHSAEHEEVG